MNKLKINNLVFTLGTFVAFFAFMVTTINVNTACFWIMHQDEVPKSAKKLRKF